MHLIMFSHIMPRRLIGLKNDLKFRSKLCIDSYILAINDWPEHHALKACLTVHFPKCIPVVLSRSYM